MNKFISKISLFFKKSKSSSTQEDNKKKVDKNRIINEFQIALDACSASDINRWGGRVVKILSLITIRRIEGLFYLIKSVSGFLVKESLELTQSIFEGRFVRHIKEKTESIVEGVKDLKDELKESISEISKLFKEDPKSISTKLFTYFLGFYTGSGGRDGGLPDLDFLMGIGAHRSIITHSILVGIIAEALLLSTLQLALIVHENLPEDHDPWWDELKENTSNVTNDFVAGLSFGISTHLTIDATIDGGGTYKDLPVPLPMIGHQTIMGVNAVTELIDSFRKSLKDPLDWICGSIETDFDKKNFDYKTILQSNLVEDFPVNIHKQNGKYSGETLNSLPHGKGVFTSIRKLKNGKVFGLKMEGEFIEGEFLGKAKVAYADGGYYEGPIRGNLKSHGFGIIKYPNGSKYFGNWRNGKREGYGIYHFPKGESQVGEWVNGELKETTQVWMKGKKVA